MKHVSRFIKGLGIIVGLTFAVTLVFMMVLQWPFATAAVSLTLFAYWVGAAFDD